MRRLAFFVLVLLVVLAHTDATATTYVIKPDGTGDFLTIQAAIDSALSGDIVQLEDGTYSGDGNRDIDFLGKSITLRSGGGNAEACILDCGGSENEPHRGVQFQSGESEYAVLLGVTITGAWHDAGAGIYCYESNPTIRKCVITENSSYHGSGGMDCLYSSPTIISCTFSHNVSTTAAGMLCFTSSPTLSNCSFIGNVTNDEHGGGTGAGFNCLLDSSPTLTDCLFDGNQGDSGAACEFEFASATFLRCRFFNNSAVERGGALNCMGSDLALLECTLAGNTAELGGGLVVAASSSVTLTNCTLNRNTATAGAGLYCSSSAVTLRNSIIAFSEGGEAVYCSDQSGCQPSLTCCDLFANEGGDWVGCIENEGWLSEDPLFCDMEEGDLRLCENSPCLPDNSWCGQLIGVAGEGCGSCYSPILETSWGGLKVSYRK